ncbi:MAG TPA: DUF1287 domain-containing protein [Pyrinomonadaceae bacterium]|nr:DUF1287 domain-containing protein [Pyrinomonadaceae bacterium]
MNTDQELGGSSERIFNPISVHLRNLWSVLFSPRYLRLVLISLLLVTAAGCQRDSRNATRGGAVNSPSPVYKSLPANAAPNLKKFIDAAVAQVGVTTGYDPSYVSLDYPGGDVPKETGVCTDVLVRAFRAVGVDLQKEIHEDMSRAWADYPKRWGLSRPDPNIDHRRVPNLMTYFDRKGKSVAVTSIADDYRPGDLVTWDLGGAVDHIGIVTDMALTSDGQFLIVHNIGAGTRVENVLFNWKITGHYRYF